MKRLVYLLLATCALVCLSSGTPYAVAPLAGYVYCDSNGDGVIDANDLPLGNIRVTVVSADGKGFSAAAVTDANGFYSVVLPLDYTATYSVDLDPSTLPSPATIVIPSTHPFYLQLSHGPRLDWLVSSPSCLPKACWLTGGGGKFSALTGTSLAEKGPQHSFGGNVYPGCDSDPGQGGQWNHVAHAMKLHFLGIQIRVVRCGNTADPPETGSESPVTPYSFIEFEGTGTLKGIKGNNVDYGAVSFFARAEDHNEPGSNGAKDGADIDKYFIHVWDSTGTTRLLLDVDGNALTVDPVTITDGNMQLHVSSCSNPPQ